MEQRTDDGFLAFLNIPRDENSRSFNCSETTQSKIANSNSKHLLKTILKKEYYDTCVL